MNNLFKSIVLVSGLVTYLSTFATECEIPKPFEKLSEEKSEQYNFNKIIEPLAKSTIASVGSEQKKLDDIIKNNHLEEIHKMPKLINFWATWCAPCREELPLLKKISEQKLADVRLINVGDKAEDVNRLLADIGVFDLSSMLSEADLLSELSLVGLPASIVWDESFVYLGVGKFHDNVKFEDWLRCIGSSENNK